MNVDYLFADTNMLASDDNRAWPNIQPLILNEFQPLFQTSVGDILMLAGDKALGGVVNVAAGSSVADFLSMEFKNQMLNEASEDPSKLYGMTSTSHDVFTPDPMRTIKNLFNGGNWLNTYQLPFDGGDWLESNVAARWKAGTSEKSAGATIAAITKALGIDYPGYATFDRNGLMDASRRKSVVSDFYLINKNIKWLKKNYDFIQSFFAGTQWLHAKYCLIVPPNVYHVVCPGRFQMYWASVNCTVTFEGKLRKVPKMAEYAQSPAVDADTLWPDAWHMVVTINDISPNNYNVHADYLMHGVDEGDLVELTYQRDIKDAVVKIGSYLTEVGTDALKTAKTMAESAINTGKDALKYAGEQLGITNR